MDENHQDFEQYSKPIETHYNNGMDQRALQEVPINQIHDMQNRQYTNNLQNSNTKNRQMINPHQQANKLSGSRGRLALH